MKFRVPDIFLGVLLTVAVFAMGMVFESSRRPPTEQRAAANTAKENPGHQPERSFWNWITHDAAGFFTLWLVIVGGGQIGLFYWQLRLIRIAADDAKRAGIAAERAAKATEDAVELSRKTAQQQLRAHVMVDTSDIRLADSHTLRSFIFLKNFGQTPAYDVKSWVDMRVGSLKSLPFDQRLPFGFSTMMGPGGQFIVGPDPISISAEVPNEIKTGVKIIFVWGEVSYRDAFGKRWVFRFYVRNTAMMFNIDDGSGGTVPGWAFEPYPDFG